MGCAMRAFMRGCLHQLPSAIGINVYFTAEHGSECVWCQSYWPPVANLAPVSQGCVTVFLGRYSVTI